MPLVCNLPMSYYEQVLSTQFVLSLDRIASHSGNVWCLVFELDGKRYIFILSGSCSYLVFNSPLVLFIVNQIVSRQHYVMSHDYADIGAITKIILVLLTSIPLTTNLNNSLVTKPAVIKKIHLQLHNTQFLLDVIEVWFPQVGATHAPSSWLTFC